MITLRCHQTAIAQHLGLALDGGRGFVVVPERAFSLYNGISGFGYYIRDDLRYRMLQFYHKRETVEEYTYTQYMHAVVTFLSYYEYEQFALYVKANTSRYTELYVEQGDEGLPYFPDLKHINMDVFKKEYRDSLVMKKMLQEFRTSDSYRRVE